MTEGVVPPVVPFTDARMRQHTAGPVVPVLPTQASMVYGLGRVDASGRVADRSVVRALGWIPGEPLTFHVVDETVIVRRGPRRSFTMTRSPYVVLPAAIRNRCRIQPGDQVLLAAAPRHELLLVHTMATVDRMLSGYHDEVLGEETP